MPAESMRLYIGPASIRHVPLKKALSATLRYRAIAMDAVFAGYVLTRDRGSGFGRWGIERQIQPDAPMTGNSFGVTQPDKRVVPFTLAQDAHRLTASSAAFPKGAGKFGFCPSHERL
jgi:hypothetical protein